MTDKKVWFITGAGRGMGADFAKAALAAGEPRRLLRAGTRDRGSEALGKSDALVPRRLTSPAALMLRPRCGRRATASAASTCW